MSKKRHFTTTHRRSGKTAAFEQSIAGDPIGGAYVSAADCAAFKKAYDKARGQVEQRVRDRFEEQAHPGLLIARPIERGGKRIWRC